MTISRTRRDVRRRDTRADADPDARLCLFYLLAAWDDHAPGDSGTNSARDPAPSPPLASPVHPRVRRLGLRLVAPRSPSTNPAEPPA